MDDKNANVSESGRPVHKDPVDLEKYLVDYYNKNLVYIAQAAIGSVESFVAMMYAIQSLNGKIHAEEDDRFISCDGEEFFQRCNWITLNTEGRERDWEAEGVFDDQLKLALNALSFSLRKSMLYAHASAEVKTLPNAANSMLFCSFYFCMEGKMITLAEPVQNNELLPQSEVEKIVRKIFAAFEAINKTVVCSQYANIITSVKEKLLPDEDEGRNASDQKE